MLKITSYTLLCIFFLASLPACSPQYKIIHDFTPPYSDDGLQCIKATCNPEAKRCNDNCNLSYNTCLVSQKEEAKFQYAKQRKVYRRKMSHYAIEENRYQHQRRHYDLQKENWEMKLERSLASCKKSHIIEDKCQKSHYYKKQLHELSLPSEPRKPKQPLLHEITNDFQQQCHRNCSCQSSFRQCYLGCGGRIKSRKVCVANCE